jgi:hypothetical protein
LKNVTYSDSTLKNNIEPIVDATNILNQLKCYSYTFHSNDQRKTIGLLAHEVSQVIPDIVHRDSMSGFDCISYTDLIALLIQGFKELDTRVRNI